MFLDVAVDGGGWEAPERDVFEGGFPAAPQGGGNGDLAGGLVEEGEVAVAAFDGRVGGQSDRGKHGLGEVVEGCEGASERGGQQRVGVGSSSVGAAPPGSRWT